MRNLILVMAPLALAACGEAAEEPAPVEEPVVEETAAAMTSANGSAPGAYTVTMADGSTITSTLNGDGTYVDTDATGAVTEEGTWAVVDGKTCFTPTTEGATAMCYTESAPGADGSFTVTPDEGEPMTVMPAASAAPAAAASAPAPAMEPAPAE